MTLRKTAVIGSALIALVGLLSFPRLLLGSDHARAKELIQQACVQCHRLEGKAESRFNLRAPDLIWAGSKYRRPWLVRWLTGKEAALYAKGYRWDLSEGAVKHPVVTDAEANAIADYFEEDGKLIGGQQSAALQNAGQRYNLDWLYRFGQNPQDFIIHTGEFLADATDPQLRAVIGYLAAQGVEAFKYDEPWTSQEFVNANADRGKGLYKEYCAQCHGFTGMGDGPASAGLEPKPAIHA